VTSTNRKAHVAGALYLVMAVLAWFSLMYVPGVFVVRGDATATALNISHGQLLFRFGILSEIVSQTMFIFLVLVLYDLFASVDRRQARLMVVLVAVSVAFEFVNCLNLIAPLILLGGAEYLSVFSKPQLDSLSLGFLELRSNGINLVSTLWGLWLLPLGVLVIKSGFMPKILGILLIIASGAYVAESFTSIVFPAHANTVSMFSLPLGTLGELAIMLWLLIMGARDPHERVLT
jgi:hypothetical protein